MEWSLDDSKIMTGSESIDKFKFFLDPQKRKYLIRKNIF